MTAEVSWSPHSNKTTTLRSMFLFFLDLPWESQYKSVKTVKTEWVLTAWFVCFNKADINLLLSLKGLMLLYCADGIYSEPSQLWKVLIKCKSLLYSYLIFLGGLAIYQTASCHHFAIRFLWRNCPFRYQDVGPALYDWHHWGVINQPHAPGDWHLQRQLGTNRWREDGGRTPRAHAAGYGWRS